MSTQASIETHREGAEIYYGDETCRRKCHEILTEVDLPLGMLPLVDILELGYNRTTGFTWMKQKKSVTHVFSNIGETVSYAQEVSCFIDKHQMKKCSGVKSKQILIWLTIGDIFVNQKDPEKITFKTLNGGITRSYPVSAFQLQEEEKKKAEMMY